MKKTLFLSAILATALCSSAFAETLNYTVADGETKTQGAVTLTSGTSDITVNGSLTINNKITLNNGADLTLASSASKTSFSGNDGYNFVLETGSALTLTTTDGAESAVFDVSGRGTGVAVRVGSTLTLDENVTLKTKRVYYSASLGNSGTVVLNNNSVLETTGASSYMGNLVVNGNATFTSDNEAQLGALTINSGSKLTLDSNTKINLQLGADYIVAGTEVARTSDKGNGFGQASYKQTFGADALVTNGATIKINGNAATYSDGALTATGDSTTYYIYNTSGISVGNATKVVIDTNTTDTAAALGGGAYTLESMEILSGLVTSTHGGTDGFVKNGDVTIHAGATLQLGGGSNDVLGWATGQATKSVTLLGEEGKTATLDISHSKDGSTTLVTNLNLNGNALVKNTSTSNKAINSFGSTISATGTNNEISAELLLRKHVTVDVAAGGSLTLGKIGYQNDQADTNATLTKTGDGTLTISGNISGNVANNKNTRILGDGANTIIASSTISNMKLENVTLSKDTHTIAGAVTMQGVQATLTDFVSLDGDLTLSGTTAINMTNTGTGKGIWMQNGKTITVQDTASLAVAGDLTIKAADGNGATLTASGDTNQIGTNSAYHNTVSIDNAAITFSGDKLRDYTVTGGNVTVSHSDATVTAKLSDTTSLIMQNGSSAKFGNDIIENGSIVGLAGKNVTVGALTLGSGSTVTLGSAAKGEHDFDLTTTGLKVNGNANINANLVMNSGTLTFADNAVLTMGCDVTIGNDVTVMLTDTMVESIQAGNWVQIIAGVDNANLGQSLTFAGSGTMSDYVNEHEAVYSLKQVGDKVYITPEPATATLSLLALAALATRRKRH